MSPKRDREGNLSVVEAGNGFDSMKQPNVHNPHNVR